MPDRSAPTHLDAELEDAIKCAVSSSGQDERLARRLIAWLVELSAGGTTLDKSSEVNHYFDNLCAAMHPEENSDES